MTALVAAASVFPKRRRHRLHAFVDPLFFPGVCGASGALELLNFSTWKEDCSHVTNTGHPLCYLVDRDVHNDAEPWQELELVMFERWLASPHNCNHGPTADGCRSRADIVVLPSALAHCRAVRRYKHWSEAMVDGRSDVHDHYWDALRRRDEAEVARRMRHRTTGSGAAVVRLPRYLITYDGTWQMGYGLAMLSALSRQPSTFVRRILIASIESALQIEAHAAAFREPAASPTFLSAPFTILTRGVISAARERTERPIAVLFSGRTASAFDGSRAKVYDMLRASGAECRDGHDQRRTCTVRLA